MASMIPCVKNNAAGYTFYISLVSQADTKIFKANPTLVAADFNIAIDDGAPNALGTTPAVDADFTKRVKVVLSQDETNGDNLTIICSDAAGAEWCDLTINIQTAAQTLDATDVVADAIKTQTDKLTFTVANKVDANVYTWNGTAVSTPSTAGIPEVNIKNIANAAVSTSSAQIGTNVVNWKGATAPVMTGDAYATLTAVNTELSATPTTTGTLQQMIQFLFEYFRNKKTVTATTENIYKEDATTILGTATCSDDLTTFTKGEMNTPV